MSEKILTQTAYGCKAEGVQVVLIIGDKEVRMDYEVAFKISAFLRHAAGEAKRAAGDFHHIITGTATLTDANAEEMKVQKSRDGTAVFTSG